MREIFTLRTKCTSLTRDARDLAVLLPNTAEVQSTLRQSSGTSSSSPCYEDFPFFAIDGLISNINQLLPVFDELDTNSIDFILMLAAATSCDHVAMVLSRWCLLTYATLTACESESRLSSDILSNSEAV